MVWPPGSHLVGQLHLYGGHDGKRTGPPVAAATTGRGSQCPLLFVRDTSGRRFLVDSGSEVSILPVGTPVGRAPLTNVPKLRAANGTLIDIFETDKLVELDLGLGRTYPFKFFVAAVPEAILGADFLRAHVLVPDLRATRLYDRATFLSAACSTHPGTPADISSKTVHVKVERKSPVPSADGEELQYVRHLPVFRSLLDTPGRFPAVAMPGVEHCICSRGAPVYARPRRLTPAKLAAARKELDELLRCSILVPSHSQWASPIHLVPKDKGAGYRMVGCYERLNAVTVPDSKIDLARVRADPDEPNGPEEDRDSHSLWAVRIYQNAIWATQSRPNLPTSHGYGVPRPSEGLRLYRRCPRVFQHSPTAPGRLGCSP
ncbi:hypothetical protein M513_10215 [Trichuris suis]|uniref:Peptidase A2 domain-containing protein n=1 Tax=Trichuris suis TaxID=68888 RepID=A0A085LV56_9BILA|nr:hypothetical protein M513_10215 [Trichuris suis]